MISDVVVVATARERGHTLAQHPIKSIDEHVDRLVGIVGRDRCDQVRPGNLDVPFRLEATSAAHTDILKIEANPDDAWFVAEEPLELLRERRLHGGGQLQINPAKHELRAGKYRLVGFHEVEK